MPNIAIIDSDPELARVLEAAFATRGHKLAFLANSCSEALEKLKMAESLPDMLVVSSDHGSEKLATIKAEYPSVIVREVMPKKAQQG